MGYHLFIIGEADEVGKLLNERECFALAKAARHRALIEAAISHIFPRAHLNPSKALFTKYPKPLAMLHRYEKVSTQRLIESDRALREGASAATSDSLSEPRDRERRRDSVKTGLKQRKPSTDELVRRLRAKNAAGSVLGRVRVGVDDP